MAEAESAAVERIDLPIKAKYQAIRSDLTERHGYANPMAVPRVEKIVLNMGVGDARDDRKVLDRAADDLAKVALQRPVVTKAKKSVSNFKVRTGMPVGLKVTLRRERMFESNSCSPNSVTTPSTPSAASTWSSSPVPRPTRKRAASSSCSACRSGSRGKRGHQSQNRRVQADAQILRARRAAVQPLRADPRVPAGLRPVPHLHAGDGPQGLPSRRDEIELVDTRDSTPQG
jgi:hypothetical protein